VHFELLLLLLGYCVTCENPLYYRVII